MEKMSSCEMVTADIDSTLGVATRVVFPSLIKPPITEHRRSNKRVKIDNLPLLHFQDQIPYSKAVAYEKSAKWMASPPCA